MAMILDKLLTKVGGLFDLMVVALQAITKDGFKACLAIYSFNASGQWKSKKESYTFKDFCIDHVNASTGYNEKTVANMSRVGKYLTESNIDYTTLKGGLTWCDVRDNLGRINRKETTLKDIESEKETTGKIVRPQKVKTKEQLKEEESLVKKHQIEVTPKQFQALKKLMDKVGIDFIIDSTVKALKAIEGTRSKEDESVQKAAA